MKSFAFATCIGILALASANAQEETQRFSADFGGGYTIPVGASWRYLDEGWSLHGGFGYNFSPYVASMLNVGYSDVGVNSATLRNIGVPGGGVHIFHATIDPVVHLTPKRQLDFYVTGGGGIFHRTQVFTAPTTVFTSAYIPFFGYNAGGANQVLGESDVTKPGYDVGAGLNVGGLRHGKFFLEAKYYHMFLTNAHTDFVPVTFGYRW